MSLLLLTELSSLRNFGLLFDPIFLSDIACFVIIGLSALTCDHFSHLDSFGCENFVEADRACHVVGTIERDLLAEPTAVSGGLVIIQCRLRGFSVEVVLSLRLFLLRVLAERERFDRHKKREN